MYVWYQDVAFYGKDYREIPHVSQEEKNHNICDAMLDCGSGVLQGYRLKYDSALKNRILLEIDVIWA